MTNREALKSLVWRRMPTDLKVTASGMKFVSVGGKLTRLDSMSDPVLFAVLRMANTVNTVVKALETKEAA